LHVNILKNDIDDLRWKEEIPKAIVEIFTYCKSVGGTISGEHGIGLVQSPYFTHCDGGYPLFLIQWNQSHV
jgi:glycolate oxidase